MADTTKLTIELQILLRNLNQTLRGLERVQRRLERIAAIRVDNRQTVADQRAALAAQRLNLQQQRLILQTQELANRQERARQISERLALSQQRLTLGQQRLARAQQRLNASFGQSDHHVRWFKEMLKAAPQMDHHVRMFRALQRQVAQTQAELKKAPQLDHHVRIFRALQRQAAEARAELAKAPQMDAHVRAFRAIQRAAAQFNRTLTALGNSLRSVGQGLASFGATLSFSVSAPLAALAVNVVDAAVRMDSLRRGLNTIAGSSEEAAKQLERLTEIAKLPGIGFEEAVQGSIALQAVGFSAQEAERALVQFSNAVALTGGSREQLQTITVQLGQMAAQSKVLAADLKPIINAAPAVALALRNAFGTVRSEEIQELGIQSKDFIDIMIKELSKLPRAAAGARNSFDNFRDSVFRAAATIGQSLLPALVRLADTLGPIVLSLANAFAALPAPIQSTVLVIGALVIALGPFTFIFGQLITGIGRVIVGFAQLNAIGLLPTIANFRLLGRVMIGTASLAQGAAATAAAAAIGWATLAGAVVGIVGLIAAIVTLSQRTEENTATTEEQARATEASLKILRAQEATLSKVTSETEAVANASDELKTIYKSLNRESQGRVTLMQREVGLTRALRQEIFRLIAVRQGEQRIQAAATAASIVTTAQQVETLGRQIDSTINRVDRLTKARAEIQRTGRTTQVDPFLSSIASSGTLRQIEQIDEKLKELATDTLTDLRKKSDEAVESLSKQNDLLLQLETSTGRTTREILEAAKQYGFFKGDVDTAAKGIEAFRNAQVALQAALSGTTEEVIRQRLALRQLSGPADEAQKQRRLLIDAAVDFARENSNSIDEAKKKLEEFAEKFPEVRKAIEDEKRKGPIEEFLREFTGRKRAGGGRDSGTSLRNAQQQLADALVQIALAQGERQVEIEQDTNAAMLQAAEVGQRLRIISYREYLETRAALAEADLKREIDQQEEIFKAAKETQLRLLREATRAGIPVAERTRRQAQAAQAEEEAIRAETRLIVLRRQRERIEVELTQAIRESQDQQLTSTRQLEIQYAELQGRIQDAMEAAVVEEFREQLEELGKAQDFLNKQFEKASKAGKADLVAQLQLALNLNQRQIEAINNIVRQRSALAELAAAEKLIEQAKERQQRLEQELRFQVEFRGLSEEEAIQRRLEGEQKLQAGMQLSASMVQRLQQQFIDLGITPPPELQKFLDNLSTEILGLAELPFNEQFRLAEKEFQRLNDERIRRIQDVERAVNNRTISEAEGLLFIRKINGEYVGDLERQLQLLKEIAARSNDANLQRQAQAAEETVKDANDRLASFGKQLRSTAIDAARSSFVEFFQSLRDNTITAQERILGLIDSVVNRINEVIAENLFDELMRSIFGNGDEDGGLIVNLKRLFGFGGGGGEELSGGDLGAQILQSQAALETGAITAATTLTTGAATAAATQTTAAAGFATAITAAASGFVAAVTAAGAAFAAAVTAASAAQGFSTGLSAAGGSGIGNFAVGDLIPARRGGVLATIAEGGYPEAVLTTDPKHAQRQLAILRAFLSKTRGLGGRIPGFAMGDLVTPDLSLNIPSVSIPSAGFADADLRGGGQAMNVRIMNLLDKRQLVGGHLRSAEGSRDIVNIISENAPEIGRSLGIR